MSNQINNFLNIVVVTYNSAETIIDCISSLIEAGIAEDSIIVIDNNSIDNTVSILKIFKRIILLKNKFNEGFSRACNQGLALCDKQYVYFFNPDAKLILGEFLPFLEHVLHHNNYPLFGHRILNVDGSEQENIATEFPGQKYLKTMIKSWLNLGPLPFSMIGAGLLCDREKLLQLEGFDEDFFLYGEDLDLCTRYKKNGYLIGYYNKAVSIHVGGHSEKKTPTWNVLEKKSRATVLFYRKHLNSTSYLEVMKGQIRKLKRRQFELMFSKIIKAKDREKYKNLSRQIELYNDNLQNNSIEILKNVGFCRSKLEHPKLDNSSILVNSSKGMMKELFSLTHRSKLSLSENISFLDLTISRSIIEKAGLPVVRFADGEYSFYFGSMACNGLYKQAENLEEILISIPRHMQSIKVVSTNGILAPLFHDGNMKEKISFRKKLKGYQPIGCAGSFLDLISLFNINLHRDNYVPFYSVYAYLTSSLFLKTCHQKKICLLNSDYNAKAAQTWFSRCGQEIFIEHVELPHQFLATRWIEFREKILNKIPRDSALCLVGGRIGALEVCVDISTTLSIPAIDGGHVLNMINDKISKSAGPRLFTNWISDELP
jgi:N-acetylglucosaminyl-diphospho-decaprenol L-rhamnosyltransferase